jgi:hypothetical protein
MPTRPRRIYISFKGDRGFIDMTFMGSTAHLFSPLVQPILEDDMTDSSPDRQIGSNSHQSRGIPGV